jgi:hypothetical protein
MEVIAKNPTGNHYLVETYAFFTNLDTEILKVNPTIEPMGYTFMSVTTSELERDFSALFSLPEKFESQAKVSIPGHAGFMTNEFYEALVNNPIFGVNLLMHGRVILLKRVEDYTQEIIKNQGGYSVIDLDTSPMFRVSKELQEFVDDLILHFRLIKAGDPDYILQFQIGKESRKIVSRKSRAYGKQFSVMKFDLSESELMELQSKMDSGMAAKIRENGLTQLALSNFTLSYEILDLKTRFVTLTTALECLFNYGKGEITHIVSRHLALISSANKSEFAAHFKHIKKLYDVRSGIVHGSSPSKDLVDRLRELESYVRRAINYCIALNPSEISTSKELFDLLNAAGYTGV